MAMAKKCRLESEVGFLISIKNIQVAYRYFVKCKRTILEPNSLHSYQSSERERKFRRHSFMSSIKHETRHFHLVVMRQWYIMYIKA